MNTNITRKFLGLLVIFALLTISLAGCAPAQETPAEPAAEVEEPAEEPEEPAAEKSSITILIPDNPIASNGINTDTGYEQAMGELVMLSLAEVGPRYGLL